MKNLCWWLDSYNKQLNVSKLLKLLIIYNKGEISWYKLIEFFIILCENKHNSLYLSESHIQYINLVYQLKCKIH